MSKLPCVAFARNQAHVLLHTLARSLAPSPPFPLRISPWLMLAQSCAGSGPMRQAQPDRVSNPTDVRADAIPAVDRGRIANTGQQPKSVDIGSLSSDFKSCARVLRLGWSAFELLDAP
eukprot:3900953-Pleurochrysis_carterae.AAC.1